MEKTDEGFSLRVKDGSPEVQVYSIRYRIAPAAAPALTTGISVNVLGAANQPGTYVLPIGATLLDALAAAGCTTRFADNTKISMIRGPAGEKATTLTYNGEKLVLKKIKGPELKDGDTVFVPEILY